MKQQELVLQLTIEPVHKGNWETALDLEVHPSQREWVPTVAESLASAYICPDDEQIDPYAVYINGVMVGFFYYSYTPGSRDNYWICGFFIDKAYQRQGYGTKMFAACMNELRSQFPECSVIQLTVHEDNKVAQRFYRKRGFHDTGIVREEAREIVYQLTL